MRRLTSVVVAALFLLALASPASAGGGATGGADPDGSGASVGVKVPGGSGGGGTRGGGSGADPNGGGGSGCPAGYRADEIIVNDLSTGASITACDVYCGSTFLITRSPCGGARGGADAAPRITGADVAQQALARFRLRAPRPGMWPEPDRLVVQWPVQLWLTGGWEPQSATASAGGLSATVTARPERVTWTMGDGGSVTCSTAGSPVSRVGGSDCSYTYRVSSAGRAGDAYRVSVAVTFAASWRATDGTGGDLGPLTSPAGSVTVQVGEVQAVNTPAPGGGG